MQEKPSKSTIQKPHTAANSRRDIEARVDTGLLYEVKKERPTREH